MPIDKSKWFEPEEEVTVEDIPKENPDSTLPPLRGKMKDKEQGISVTFWINPRAHERMTRIIAFGRDPRLGAFKSDFLRDAIEDRMDKHDAMFGTMDDAPSIHYKKYQTQRSMQEELRALKEQREFLDLIQSEIRLAGDDEDSLDVIKFRARNYYEFCSPKIQARLKQIIPDL